jgi:protein-S-isoprenylcysteine O-methyltransferase Ste14
MKIYLQKFLWPPSLVILCWILMLLLNRFLPLFQLYSSALKMIGGFIFAIGAAIALNVAIKFARIGTNIKTFDEPGKLVTGGLFKYSRNPIYLGFAIALFGIAISLGSITPLIVAIAFVVITDRWYIKFEENAMSKKFGKQYEIYKLQTRRWI